MWDLSPKAKRWRWTHWLTVIIVSPLQLLFLLLYRESYWVRTLQKKTARLHKQTRNPELRSKYEVDKRRI